MLALLVKVPFLKPLRKFPVEVERGVKRHLLPGLGIAGATLEATPDVVNAVLETRWSSKC